MIPHGAPYALNNIHGILIGILIGILTNLSLDTCLMQASIDMYRPPLSPNKNQIFAYCTVLVVSFIVDAAAAVHFNAYHIDFFRHIHIIRGSSLDL